MYATNYMVLIATQQCVKYHTVNITDSD